MTVAATERVGRYQLLDPIGVGPSGTVSRAKVFGVAGFERQFAIKRFHPDITSTAMLAQALSAAARAYGSLEHPRIARMSEFGVAQGTTFTAVEYIAGLDALRLIAEVKMAGSTLAPGGALALVSQAARAVGYAHGRGLTHLGLAPTNVMITAEGDIKITDFGILAATLPPRAVEVPRLLNRIPYLAPEQLANEATSAATDVFALGVLAYELVTGHRTFRGETAQQIAQSVMAGPPIEPPLPRPIVRVLQRCLARSPFERFPDARALADALDAALRVAPVPGTRKDIGAQVKQTMERIAALHEGEMSGVLALNINTGPIRVPIPSAEPPPPVALGRSDDFATDEFQRLQSEAGLAPPSVPGESRMTVPDVRPGAISTVTGLPPMPVPVPQGVAPPPIPPPPPAIGTSTLVGIAKPTPLPRPAVPPPLPGTVTRPGPAPGVLPLPRLPTPRPIPGSEPATVRLGPDTSPRATADTAPPPAPAAPATAAAAVAAPSAGPAGAEPRPGAGSSGPGAGSSAPGAGSVSGGSDPSRRITADLSIPQEASVPVHLPGTASAASAADDAKPPPSAGGESPAPPGEPAAFAGGTSAEMQAATDEPPDIDGPEDDALGPGGTVLRAGAPPLERAPTPLPVLHARGGEPPPPPPAHGPGADHPPPPPYGGGHVLPDPQGGAYPTEPAPHAYAAPGGYPPATGLAMPRRDSHSPGPSAGAGARGARRLLMIVGGVVAAGALAAGGWFVYGAVTGGSAGATTGGGPVAGGGSGSTGSGSAGSGSAAGSVPTVPGDAAIATAPADASPPDAAKPTELSIVSAPPGARVFLDGADVGTTPLKLPGTPDRHTVALLLTGHDLYVAQIDGQGTFTIPLKKITPGHDYAGIKVIRCKDKDRYYVYVDGKPSGQTCPTERIYTTLGKHTVEVYDIVTETRRKWEIDIKDGRISHRIRIDP